MSLVIDCLDARQSGLRAEISDLRDKLRAIEDNPELEEAYEKIIDRKEAQWEALNALWDDLHAASIVAPRCDSEIGKLPDLPHLNFGGGDE